MSVDAPDWSRLMSFWDGTNIATMYESVPIFKISELPSLTEGNATIGNMNSKYFPTVPTKMHFKGGTVVVGAGDGTKTGIILLADIAWINKITVYSSNADVLNDYKIEIIDAGDNVVYVLINTIFDSGSHFFPQKIPYELAADYKVRLTYTNSAAVATTISWHVDYLYAGDFVLGRVVSSFDSPGGGAAGLAWDGTNLWHSDVGTNTIYKLNPATGAVISSFASPAGDPAGLAWDGTYLWCCDNWLHKIYKLNPDTGAVIFSFDSPANTPQGLAWDGTYLWCCTDTDDKIYKLNPATGAVISSFDAPFTCPLGLTRDGTYLWYLDRCSDKIYKLNPVTGHAILSFDCVDLNMGGLTWDGTYLWCANNTTDKIYKIEVYP